MEGESLTLLGETKSFVRSLSLIFPENLHVPFRMSFIPWEVVLVGPVSEDLGRLQRRRRGI